VEGGEIESLELRTDSSLPLVTYEHGLKCVIEPCTVQHSM